MATIINYDAQRIEKVTVKELSYSIQLTITGNNMQVESFEILNDNLPNCAAHSKVLYPEEMVVIYEYMKKMMEGFNKK